MVLDDIEAAAADVMGAQARRIFIGNATALKSFGAASHETECVQLLQSVATAFADDCVLQGGVRREEIDVLERRRLVRDIMCRKRVGHDPPGRSPGAPMAQITRIDGSASSRHKTLQGSDRDRLD